MKRASPARRSALILVAVVGANACAGHAQPTVPSADAITLSRQGSYAVGGTVVTSPGTFDAQHPTAAGATLHGDHAYVFYQVPLAARPLPLIFWHGAGQSKKTWETTVDGRDGFQNLFLRRRFAVYLLDQPRRGAAGRSTEATTIAATPDDQMWFGMFRIGVWPAYFPGVQFSQDPQALDQYFRAMTPNTGPYPACSSPIRRAAGRAGSPR
jgi:hypothetical protein